MKCDCCTVAAQLHQFQWAALTAFLFECDQPATMCDIIVILHHWSVCVVYTFPFLIWPSSKHLILYTFWYWFYIYWLILFSIAEAELEIEWINILMLLKFEMFPIQLKRGPHVRIHYITWAWTHQHSSAIPLRKLLKWSLTIQCMWWKWRLPCTLITLIPSLSTCTSIILTFLTAGLIPHAFKAGSCRFFKQTELPTLITIQQSANPCTGLQALLRSEENILKTVEKAW